MSSSRFATLPALQKAHAELVRDIGRNLAVGENPDRVAVFVERAIGTGAVLDAADERDAAQGLIGYWTTGRMSMARRESDGQPLPEFDDTLLAAYDPATIADVVAATDRAFESLPTDADKRLWCRIFLRLVRLRPTYSPIGRDQPAPWEHFDLVPSLRSALQDLGRSSRVDELLQLFEDSGVIRVTAGESPAADRVALRSPAVLKDWEVFPAWLNYRIKFRYRAESWRRETTNPPIMRRWRDRLLDWLNAFGAWTDRCRIWLFNRLPALNFIPDYSGGMLTPAEQDDSHRLSDRTDVEREFTRASRFDGERMIRRNRLLLALFMIMTGFTTVGWMYATWSTFNAREHAAETRERGTDVKARSQLSNLRLLVRGLADLVTAREAESIRIAEKRWDTLVRTAFDSSFDLLSPDQLTKLKNEAVERRTVGQYGRLSTESMEMLRQALKEIAQREEIQKALVGVRKVAYDVVAACANETVEGLRKPTPRNVQPFIREFFRQYWGEMLLVEGPEVENAMVDFARELERIPRDPSAVVTIEFQNRLQEKAATLKAALAAELDSSQKSN